MAWDGWENCRYIGNLKKSGDARASPVSYVTPPMGTSDFYRVCVFLIVQ